MNWGELQAMMADVPPETPVCDWEGDEIERASFSQGFFTRADGEIVEGDFIWLNGGAA